MKLRLPKWTPQLTALIILGLVVDYFFLHLLFEKKEAELRQKTELALADIERAVLKEAPSASLNLNTSSPNTEPATSLSSSLAENLNHCLGYKLTPEPQGVDDLFKILSASEEIESEEIDIENINFSLTDGSERRIHIIPKDASNGETREIRYYKVDDEGYPERLSLPNGVPDSYDPQTIAKLINKSPIKLHQFKKTYKRIDGSVMSVDLRNDRAFELQLQTPDRSFVCSQEDCQCL